MNRWNTLCKLARLGLWEQAEFYGSVDYNDLTFYRSSDVILCSWENPSMVSNRSHFILCYVHNKKE